VKDRGFKELVKLSFGSRHPDLVANSRGDGNSWRSEQFLYGMEQAKFERGERGR
jgi:hypothetical protein